MNLKEANAAAKRLGHKSANFQSKDALDTFVAMLTKREDIYGLFTTTLDNGGFHVAYNQKELK